MHKFIFILIVMALNIVSAKENLKDFNCDKMILKAKDNQYVLKNLAALYANRNCKDFVFESKNLTDLEKKIYKVKFDELDENKKNDLSDSESLETLKLKYKLAEWPIERFEAFKKLRQKYKLLGQKENSLNLIKNNHAEISKLVKSKSKKINQSYFDVYADSTSIYAKALWNNKQIEKANDIILKSLKIEGLKTNKYSLLFLKGKIEEDQLMFDAAIKSYDAALANYKLAKDQNMVSDKSFDVAKTEWSKTWIQYKNDKPANTAISLKNIIESTTDPAEKSRALFFLSKIYKKLNKLEESKKALEDNISNDFFSFYSLASYSELGKALPALNSFVKNNVFIFDPELSFLNKENKSLFLALSENDEFDIADRACTVLAKNNTELVNMGLHLAEKNQYFNPLFLGYAKAKSTEKKDIFIKHSRLLFPEVHTDKVLEMSKKTNVDKSLIYSIMKQESGFNPESRSPANAKGLMQVIPSLATSLAKKYSITDFKKPDDLYNPLVNIELGTYELKDQVARQNGQLSFVASAYNAGPGALKQWRDREPIQDMFEFIENIPYDETRTYVKIIARNMLFYQRLAAPDKEQVFPQDFIKIIN